jgi:gliding-associated putative ABC transporter substrate-binding component GldG
MKKTSYLTTILLLLAIFIVVAAISDRYFLRLDLTEGGQYSLSDATKAILKNLDEPVTVTAYFTGDLEPQLAKVKNDFRDLLVEYNSASGGKVVYKFENPNADQETEAEALQAGVQPVLFNVREKDEQKQKKVFMGAVINKGIEKEAIPFLDPNGSMEYTMSTSIKKLTVTRKPKIGFIQGQGEPPLESYTQVMAELEILYDVEAVNINDSMPDLRNYKTLVIAAPRDTFDMRKIQMLDDYLATGGRLMIAMNNVEGDLQTLQGKVVWTGLQDWLREKGIDFQNALLVDVNNGNISVSQRTNFGVMTSQMRFPYFPAIRKFADHPATKGLEQVQFTFMSPIRYVGDTSLTFTPLAFTSDQTGVKNLPVFLDINQKWSQADFNRKNEVVACLLEGRLSGNNNAKMIVISNGDFAVNAGNNRQNMRQPDNISLMVNSIDWLSDDTGLIDLRTKSVTSRPIDAMGDARKNTLRWLNFLLPIALVLIYGLIRMQLRRNQRMKRMEEGYVR